MAKKKKKRKKTKATEAYQSHKPVALAGKAEFDAAAKLYRDKQYDEAGDILNKAIEENPDVAPLHSLLGEVRKNQGNTADALMSIRRAAQLEPQNEEYPRILGVFLQSIGKFSEAAVAVEQSYHLQKPEDVGRRANLANIVGGMFLTIGEGQSAIEWISKSLELNPNSAGGYNNLGLCYLNGKRAEESLEYFEKAISLQDDFFDAHVNFAAALNFLDRLDEAVAHYERALEIKPDNAISYNNLAGIYRSRGELGKAIEFYKSAIKYGGSSTQTQESSGTRAHSNLLFSLAYSCALSPEDLLRAHQDWFKIQAAHLMDETKPFALVRDKNKKLKIGYISHDFRQHSVSFFISSILREHDREKVETFCYSLTSAVDSVTEELENLSDNWRNMAGKSAQDIARKISNDGIDILVDLAGHTNARSMFVCALRPAPIQATYIGYMATTGLPAINYWITDWNIHPEDTEELATEEYVRLPNIWMCYNPPEGSPDVAPPPSLSGEPITFGSFNTLSKTGPASIALWASVLNAIPDSRMLIKNKGISDQYSKDKLLKTFESFGCDPERITCAEATKTITEHLEQYAKVDIALDTTPMTGGTTTAEALWMGVPVLTLSGKLISGRQSTSMLRAVGLGDWVASTPEEFVEKAKQFASDKDYLGELRSHQRETVSNSPLCDAKGVARDLEDAYRTMWERLLDATS